MGHPMRIELNERTHEYLLTVFHFTVIIDVLFGFVFVYKMWAKNRDSKYIYIYIYGVRSKILSLI